MEEGNIEYNNKILDCIIDICEFHPPRNNNLGIDFLLINDDFFTKNVEKYFATEEIIYLIKEKSNSFMIIINLQIIIYFIKVY